MFGTFLASEMRILGRLLEHHGLDPVSVYRQAGLDYALSRDTHARVPLRRFSDAWARAAELLNDPALGLESARFYRGSDFHGLAVAFLASSTLSKALGRLARYHVVVNTGVSVEVESGEQSIDIVISQIDAEMNRRRTIEDSRASIMVDLSRSSASDTLNPKQVEFTYAAPEDARVHEEIFRCPVVFGAPRWRMSWHHEDANRAFVASNREVARANDQILDRMVRSLHADTLVTRVKKAMIEELPSGTPSEHAIAHAVAMSTRSLQRRLAEEKSSFKELLAEVRRDLAREYVEDRQLPVTDISFMLGFSDVSSFSRAFKRWYGKSPVAARHHGALPA